MAKLSQLKRGALEKTAWTYNNKDIEEDSVVFWQADMYD